MSRQEDVTAPRKGAPPIPIDPAHTATAEIREFRRKKVPMLGRGVILQPWLELCSTLEEASLLAKQLNRLPWRNPTVQRMRKIIRGIRIEFIENELPLIRKHEDGARLHRNLPGNVPKLEEEILCRWAEVVEAYTHAVVVLKKTRPGTYSHHLAHQKEKGLKPRICTHQH